MDIEELQRKHKISEEVADVLRGEGITELYPPQTEAVKKGVLAGENLVLAIPTAAGKTLVAELAMLKSIIQDGGKCLYTVPLRALASEKYEEFKEKYEPIGVNVGIATGDYDVVSSDLAEYDILIATSEKVDSLLRHKAKWLADMSTVAVFDEIHLIDDPGRGPTLEVLAARLRQLNPDLQILGLSATISNSQEIADWLDAKHLKSEWRPVPLKEGVYFQGRIIFEDLSEKEVRTSAKDKVPKIVADTIEHGGGQALVFVSTRKSTEVAARKSSKKVGEYLSSEEKKSLEEVAQEVENALGEPTETCRKLSRYIRQGAAFHHAGLHHSQRTAIEDAFREGLIKVICATPTLAAGVNLPSQRTIIRDYKRYSPPYGMKPIPVLEYKQMCMPYEEEILLSDGSKKMIGRIVEDGMNEVMTYNVEEDKLEPKKIAQVYNREADEIIEIATETGDFRVTPNHPVLVWSEEDTYWKKASELEEGEKLKWISNNEGAIPYFYEIIPQGEAYVMGGGSVLSGYKEKLGATDEEIARRLGVDESLLYHYREDRKATPFHAALKASKEIGWDKDEISEKFREVKSAYGNPLELPPKLTKDLLWLVGLVVTDGNLNRMVDKRTGSTYITIRIFNSNENIIERAREVFGKLGLETYETKEDGKYCLEVGNTLLARILNSEFSIPYGKKSRRTKIPSTVFGLPVEYRASFVEGVFDGDGSYGEAKHGKQTLRRVLFTTSSREFAEDLQQLLSSMGIKSRISNVKTKPKVIDGEKVQFSGVNYSIVFNSKGSISRFAELVNPVKADITPSGYSTYHNIDKFHSKKNEYTKVKSINAQKENEQVYNLSVEDNENYVTASGSVVHNCGRAGRPGYDDHGESIVISSSEAEKETLMDEYVRAEPERIKSKLASEPAIRTHVLGSIAAGYVNSLESMLEFIEQTFFAYQFSAGEVSNVIEGVLDFLKGEDLVSDEGRWLSATKFGKKVSQLYIDPLSGVKLRDGLENAGSERPSEIGVLHAVCSTPDMDTLYLRKREDSDLDVFVSDYAEAGKFLLEPPEKWKHPEKYEFFLAEVKTAKMLQDWINEKPEEKIHERYSVGAGDIRRKVSTAEWLLYAGYELAKLFKVKNSIESFRSMQQRVKYGIEEELLELVSLRGIGRVRARNLFESGYRSEKDIQEASLDELTRVSHIGEGTARRILKQVSAIFSRS